MVNMASKPVEIIQTAVLVPVITGCYMRYHYMSTHEGKAPPKSFSVPTRIKLIDNWMLMWPLLAMIITSLLIHHALKSKFKVRSLSEGREAAGSTAYKGK